MSPHTCMQMRPRPHMTHLSLFQDGPLLGSGEVPGGRLCGGRGHAFPVSCGWSLGVGVGGVSVAIGVWLLILRLFPLPLRTILFSNDGGCLLSGGRDALRVYGWEPERCFDTVPVPWGRVSDLAICNNQLVSGWASHWVVVWPRLPEL